MWKAAGISTLEEMRAYPAEKFQEVLMKYMQQQKSFGLPYSPCVDGELLTAPLDETARNGQELDIPYLIGYTSEDMMPEVMKKAATDWSLLLEQQGRKPALRILFQPRPARRRHAFIPRRIRRHERSLPLLGTVVHVRHAWQMLATNGKSRLRVERTHGKLLDKLCQNRQSQWGRLATMGTMHKRQPTCPNIGCNVNK